MSDFSPVFLPPDRALNDRGSMTFLKHANGCMRSGYLYAKYRGEASTPEMQRGRAVHEIIERAIRTCVEQGESIIPPELVKAISDEVLAEVHVPMEEHDAIREMAHRFGSEFAVNPGGVVALETLFHLDIDGFQVRCRIDFAELLEGGAAVAVRDWKSSRGAPGFEEISRLRPDGTRMGRNMQLLVYCLALAFGVPVREEPCSVCSGLGYTGDAVAREPCEACGGSYGKNLQGRQDVMGRGVVEVPEPFAVAARAQRFEAEFVYPAIEDREGKMLRRPVSLTRLELEEAMGSLRGLVARVRAAEKSGDWPAVISDEACSTCPASSLCPIPAELRDHRGEINTVAEFAETMSRLEREEAEMRARKKEAREFVKAHGGSLGFGGKVAELVYAESEQITDRDGLFEAVERAVRFGEPFDRSRFVKVRGSTRFVTRDVTVEELAEEAVAGD